MTYQDSTLWQSFVGGTDQEEEIVSRLRTAFSTIRNNAAQLTSQIQIDLPDYTVHDINHLDSLWICADQIIGKTTKLNPLEIFVLGCSFLFHDAGMTLSAFPKGLKEVKETREWKKLVGRTQKEVFLNEEERERALLGIFLREQHASISETLPFSEWHDGLGTCSLMQDSDLRQKFGTVIGKISSSHWWSHEKLERELHSRLPAPTGYPAKWPIDVLKVACVLRCADASNIDSSRAPGFLWALRKGRISRYSNMHWSFQNRLTPPELREDALHYGSTYDFKREDSAEWWLAYDTICMVDTELRQSDAMLARVSNGTTRLAAKRVADVDSPISMTSQIGVRGWQPVDTSFTISDIPKLVGKLGGDQLYGRDYSVPLRELVMNGMDAIRVRRKVDPTFVGSGEVTVSLPSCQNGQTLVVQDQGIGMNSQSIVANLLSFGTSGWLNDPAIGEFTENFMGNDDVSGQYGIGFFSIFMLGRKIRVITRRYDEAVNDTVVLEFTDGLDERPILYQAEGAARLTIGGTRIEVVLELDEPEDIFESYYGPGYFLEEPYSKAELLGVQFPTSDVKLMLRFGEESTAIYGGNWQTEPAADLFDRVHPGWRESFSAAALNRYLTPVFSEAGEIIGRLASTQGLAAAAADAVDSKKKHEFDALKHTREGAFIYRGAVISRELRALGVLSGRPMRAARDAGEPACSPESLRSWISLQTNLLSQEENLNFDSKLSIAGTNYLYGFGNCELPICELGGEALSMAELERRVSTMDEIWLGDSNMDRYIRQLIDIEKTDERYLSCDIDPLRVFEEYSFSELSKRVTLSDHDSVEAKIYDRVLSLLNVSIGESTRMKYEIRKLGRKSMPVLTDRHQDLHSMNVTVIKRNMTREMILEENTTGDQ